MNDIKRLRWCIKIKGCWKNDVANNKLFILLIVRTFASIGLLQKYLSVKVDLPNS